jgi:hypothetical protein
VFAALALAGAGAIGVAAQQGGRYVFAQGDDPEMIENAPYQGEFVFARIRYEMGSGPGGFGGFRRRRDAKWDHDTPRAEIHLMKILTELSDIRPRMDGGNIFTTDDPELMKYPLAYLSEPGFWTPTDKEVEGLRTYLAKGGFLIVDDFSDEEWFNFEEQMRRVLPEGKLVKLEASHPIFDSFFHISRLDIFGHQYRSARAAPEFWGMYEDNDPAKRLILIANYNNDIGDLWEYSDMGYIPIDLSNEAYKLGVNYVIYAMTH